MTEMKLETEHKDPEAVAGAISPDNTDEMETSVKDGAVVTSIEREDIESAGATADDYLRNVVVADELLDTL